MVLSSPPSLTLPPSIYRKDSHVLHLRLVSRPNPQQDVLRLLRLPNPQQDRHATLPGAWPAARAEGGGPVR
jgi:hypothetical protein